MQKHRLTRRAARLLAVAGMLVGLTLPATAEEKKINPEQACRDDAFRLCNDLIPDRDKVGACLRKNGRKLSKDCHTVVFGGTHRRTTQRTYHHHSTQ